MNKIKYIEPLVSLLTLVVTILGLWLVIIQIRESGDSTNQLLRSANDNTVLQIMYSLNQRLITPPNSDIFYTIDSGLSIRKIHHGQFSDTKLEDYLSIYEALAVVYSENKTSLVQNAFLCDSFFDNAQESLDNIEIQDFLKEKRKVFPNYRSYLDVLKKAVDDYTMCPEFN